MSSYNQSTNSSSSIPVQTPENAIMNQISGVASGLASQMESWAQGEYAKTSAITDQTVGNFFTVSQNMLGLSDNLTGQYNNLFAPENAQLVADANSYASPARMEADMGMAGATQAQAGDAALSNSEESLRGYGIDPSSGRYQALDQASRVQNAANVAGAENQQRVSDISTGQKLRSEAVQVGAQLPAAIANVNNTAIQANTGAENASLSNANTGVNLQQLPNQFLQTAMGVKMPFNQSQSSGQSSGSSSSPSKSDGSGGHGNGSGNGAGSGSSGPAWGMNNPAYGGGASVTSIPGQPGPTQPPPGQDPWQTGTGTIGPDTNSGVPGISDPGGLGGNGVIDTNPFSNSGFGTTLPTNDTFGGQNNTFGGVGGDLNNSGLGNMTYDPSQNQMGDTTQLQGGAWTDPMQQPAAPTDWGANAPPAPDQSANWTPAPDPGNQGNQSGSSDQSSYSGDSSGGGSYARGGAVSLGHGTAQPMPRTQGDVRVPQNGVGTPSFARGGMMRMGMRHLNPGMRPPNMASGGAIDTSMSPSGGAQTDDVNAHVNANEFVIPQDVALWKGQEFFQNLIMQSRKRRTTGSPAQPSPAPAQR